VGIIRRERVQIDASETYERGKIIQRTCSFLFALVSFYGTSRGLNAFAFTDYLWVGITLAFAIQGMLLVMNLTLPQEWEALGQTPQPSDEKSTRFQKFVKWLRPT